MFSLNCHFNLYKTFGAGTITQHLSMLDAISCSYRTHFWEESVFLEGDIFYSLRCIYVLAAAAVAAILKRKEIHY